MDMELEKIYKKYFYYYLSSILNINEYDNEIDNSNLLFNISTTYYNECNSMFNTKYIRCLNKVFVNRLNDVDKQMLLSDNDDSLKVEIIRRTFKDIIKQENVNYIMYDYDIPERIIENGFLVFEIDYGKNKKELNNEEYKDIKSKQKELLNQIKLKIEDNCLKSIGVECKVLIQKVI